MLDHLYKLPAVIARHHAAPMLGDRERFLIQCAEKGYKPRMLRKVAWLLLIIVSCMPTSQQTIGRGEIRRLARLTKAHVKCRPLKSNGKWSEHTYQLVERYAIQWYTFLGQLDTTDVSNTPFDCHIVAFQRFMREERGLSEVTIENRCLRVGNFLQSILPGLQSLESLTIQELDNYLHLQSERGWCRSSLSVLASDLRSFFRYAEGHGWCCFSVYSSRSGRFKP